MRLLTGRDLDDPIDDTRIGENRHTGHCQQHVRIANVLTTGKVANKQPLSDSILHFETAFGRCSKKHVPAQGVRRPLHQVVPELDSYLTAGKRDLAVELLGVFPAPKLR